MGEHRVSMLGASLRRYEDPRRSADPRIRRLVARLATVEPTPPPRAHFRAELRAQLVAVAPRLVAEGAAAEAPRPTRAARSAGPAHANAAQARSRLNRLFGRAGQVSIARPLGVLTAVIALFAVLLGGAVWVSKKALPGDSLYALKRANESAQLSFASGDTAKGRQYLKFAQTRAEEVAALLKRASASADAAGPTAAGGVNAHTAHLVKTTLDAADSELRSGAQLLGRQAVRSGSPQPLGIMQAWAPGQFERLKRIAARLPAGSLHDRAASSTRLTVAAYSRAQALQPVVDCKCLAKVATDQLGPLPCIGCTTPKTPGQSTAPSSGTPPVGTGTVPKATPTGTKAKKSGSGSGSGSGQTGGTNSGSSGGLPSLLPLPLPTLPLPLPTSAGSDSGAGDGERSCTIDLLGICVPL